MGFWNVTLAYFAVRICARSVKVAQPNERERIGGGAIFQYLLADRLCGAVRINRRKLGTTLGTA